MATVIDALLMTVGLDATGFLKGEKQVAQGQERIEKGAARGAKAVNKSEAELSAAQKQRAREMDARAKQMTAGLVKLRNEAIGLFAVFTAGAGLKSFVTNTISTAAGLGFLSDNLKKSTEDVQAWQRASERAGGSGSGMVAQLKESAAEIAALQNGLGPSDGVQWFFRLGGKAEDIQDGNKYLLARADIVKRIFDSGDSAKAMLMAGKLGISEDQFNFIKQGSVAMLALVEAQRKNSAITRQDAEGALQLKNRWLDFTQTIEASSTKLLVKMIPTLEQLIKWMQSIADWIDEHRDDIARWIDDAVAKLIPLLKSLGAAIKGIDWPAVGADIKTVATAIGYVADALRLVLDYITRLQEAGAFKFLAASPWGKVKMLLNGGVEEGKAASGVPMLSKRFGSGGKAGRDAVAQLMAMGWTQEQAAGLVANFQAESNLDPGAVGDGGKAYGIGQWHPDRQAAFKAQYGKDIQGSTLAEQLAFANFELRSGKEQNAGLLLGASISAREAAEIVSRHYERPADANGEASKRAMAAAALNDAVGAGNALAAARMPTGSGVALGGATGSWGAPVNTTEIKIGTIEVNTQATDAAGIAKELPGAITKHPIVMQANRGLS